MSAIDLSVSLPVCNLAISGVRSCNFLTSVMFVSTIYCISSSQWYL